MRYSVVGVTAKEVQAVGGKNIRESPRTGIVFADLTPEQVTRLKAAGAKVSEVGKVEPAVMPPTPVAAAPIYSPEQLVWAAGMEELRGITEPPLYGEGFNLAVIDTGIRESHTKINGRVVYRKNYTSDPMRDGFNHGTGVCSVAVAVAPRCNILNLKVLDDKGMGTEEEVVLAIDDCIAMQDAQPDIAPSVINLSLGSPDDGNPYDPLRVACRAAIQKGVWIIAAAGNSGPTPGTIVSPACERYVGAVGSAKYLAAERSFVLSSFSSRGPTREGLIKPDCLLFGEDIAVAGSEGDTATVARSGTSFSAPFVSAMSLLYHEGLLKYRGVEFPTGVPAGLYPEITWLVPINELIDKYLVGICVKPQGAALGKDNDYGYGLPFGPLVSQALGVRPAVDISSMVTAALAIGMMGLVLKAVK